MNHCSMFSNLDFAKVTLKTLMLFAVLTAKKLQMFFLVIKRKAYEKEVGYEERRMKGQ